MSETKPCERQPVVVVSLAALFGSVSISGDIIAAVDVVEMVQFLAMNGRYVLVDCDIPLEAAILRLNAHGIPFSGLSYDGAGTTAFDPTDYDDRVAYHCGWGVVDMVIDEDIMRLELAQKRGVSSAQVLSGCIISQVSFGKPRVLIKPITDVYYASIRES